MRGVEKGRTSRPFAGPKGPKETGGSNPLRSTNEAPRTAGPDKNEQAVCAYPAVTPGDYAISVFQDENSNGKLERNFMGMPKEGVGHRMTRRAVSGRRNLPMLVSRSIGCDCRTWDAAD